MRRYLSLLDNLWALLITCVFLTGCVALINRKDNNALNPMFIKNEMPLAWRYSVTGITESGDSMSLYPDTLEIIFLTKHDLSPFADYLNDPESSDTILSPAWLVPEFFGGVRTYIYETTLGLIRSERTSMYGTLLVPADAKEGQKWFGSADYPKMIESIGDTTILGQNYTLIKVKFESEFHEIWRFTWAIDLGLVCVETNFISPEEYGLGIRTIVYSFIGIVER